MPMLPILLSALVSASACDKDRRSILRTEDRVRRTGGVGVCQGAGGLRTARAGPPGHDKAGDWIVAEMKKRTDSVRVQRWTQTTAKGTQAPAAQHLARFNPSATQRVLYITHWDTRPVADDDLNFGNKTQPILGANDAASGVGLFVALADYFKKTPPSVGVDLLFVDGEDWGAFDADTAGNYPDALFGSQYFANHLPSPDYKPLFGVLFDMIGDADLQIYQEANSVERRLKSCPRLAGGRRPWL